MRDQPVTRSLRTHPDRNPSLEVGFQPTIPVFERAETFHALDRATTVIASRLILFVYCDIHARFRNTLCEQNAEFLDLKAGDMYSCQCALKGYNMYC
jgi:hypothetical protein